MLHSVTLWRSQMERWYLETGPDGVYLRHDLCSAPPLRLLSGMGEGTRYQVQLADALGWVTRHQCPTRAPVTPRLVDGPESGSGTGSASGSGRSSSSPSPRPT